eukprot:COSAG04_NODE_1295_length_7328_cov_9.809241_1_plen_327_part_10
MFPCGGQAHTPHERSLSGARVRPRELAHLRRSVPRLREIPVAHHAVGNLAALAGWAEVGRHVVAGVVVPVDLPPRAIREAKRRREEAVPARSTSTRGCQPQILATAPPEREELAAHVARVRSALTLPGSHTLSTPNQPAPPTLHHEHGQSQLSSLRLRRAGVLGAEHPGPPQRHLIPSPAVAVAVPVLGAEDRHHVRRGLVARRACSPPQAEKGSVCYEGPGGLRDDPTRGRGGGQWAAHGRAWRSRCRRRALCCRRTSRSCPHTRCAPPRRGAQVSGRTAACPARPYCGNRDGGGGGGGLRGWSFCLISGGPCPRKPCGCRAWGPA